MSIAGPSNGNLALSGQPSQVINAKAGSIASPSVFATGSTSTWGFAIPNVQLHGTTSTGGSIPSGFQPSYSLLPNNNTTNTALYAAVPTTATPFSATSTANPSSPHIYNVYFATRIAPAATSGTYLGTVTISGAVNLPPSGPDLNGVVMQEISLDGLATPYACPTERTRVVDARDDASYWIRRINGTSGFGGDLCWMETNLAYAGGGDNYFGDVFSWESSDIGEDLQNGESFYTSGTSPFFYIPPGANRTTEPTDPSISTNGTGQYGYLYNWCAAMGGQWAACSYGYLYQPIQDRNQGDGYIFNICPAGWRLPSGGSSTDELSLLNDVLNGGSTGSPTGLLNGGLFMYSGSWGGGSSIGPGVFHGQGSQGDYWSSDVGSHLAARHLWFDNTNTSPESGTYTTTGAAVRCVAD
ncbi:hypothetical protein FWG86_02290 [Candidatus Saccharibacteria bacterium]|nr:hypothetical protein [Candidatus Saccharibacteria bacterium]